MAANRGTELPLGWAWATLGELGSVAGGGTPSKANSAYWTNGIIPWISPKDMKADVVGNVPDKITKVALDNSAAKLIPEGSLLMVTRSGILNHTFPVAISDRPATVNQDIKALTVHTGICPWYIKRFLESRNREIVHNLVKDGTTVASIDVDRLFALPLPIAPSREQDRITAKINELFGEIEASEQELEKAREGLTDYRRAVFKAAVTGELTREWREANVSNETGHDFVLRILSQRSRAFPADHLVVPETSDLPILPNSWTWASIDQMSFVSGGMTKNAKRATRGNQVPYLRVANVQENVLNLSDIRRIGVLDAERNRVLLRRGDLLFVEGNGSPDQIGRVAVWDGSIDPCVHQNHLIKARFVESVLSAWALQWFLSPYGKSLVRKAASSTSGLHTLNISKIQRLAIPVPSAPELLFILEQLRRRLSVAEEIKQVIAVAASDSWRVRQSVLSTAFSGRLVPQDSADEPASILLERLRSASSAQFGLRKKNVLRSRKSVFEGSRPTGVSA